MQAMQSANDDDMITLEAQNRTIHTLHDVIDELKTELNVTEQENAKQEALQFMMKEQIENLKCGSCHKVSDFKVCARCLGKHHEEMKKKKVPKFQYCNNVRHLQKCEYRCNNCDHRANFETIQEGRFGAVIGKCMNCHVESANGPRLVCLHCSVPIGKKRTRREKNDIMRK